VSQELLYTSATRGLKPGSSGFCTVASTRGMSGPLASALESLSAYRHVFRPGDPQAHRNPVAWVHVRLSAGGRSYCVLSRVADYGQDYSGRNNKLAHHVALQANETPTSGPARMLEQPNFMETSWDGEPRILPVGRAVTHKHRATLGACRHWQDMTGDAGWAGVLAESFLDDPQRPVYIIFEPGMEILPLFGEAIELLPENRRWDVTFSTYFTSLPRGVTCNWRCVLAGSKEANESRRFVQALRIDLTQPLERAEGGTLVEPARTGKQIRRPSPTSASTTSDPEYSEVVGAENGGGGMAESGRGSSSYSIPGTPTVPPPPPRRRQRTGTAETDAPRRRLKLAATVAVVVVMLSTIAGGVYVLQSRKPNKSDATVAQGKPKKETKDEAKVDPPTGRTVAMSGDTTPQPATDAAEQTGSTSTAGKPKDTGMKKLTGSAPKIQPNKTGLATKKTKDGSSDKSRSGRPASAPTVVKKTGPSEEGIPIKYLKIPEMEHPDPNKKKRVKRFLVINSLELSNNEPKLSLFVPAFSSNWTSWSDGKSVKLAEQDPNSGKRSVLATLSLEHVKFLKTPQFQVFLDIPIGKHMNGTWKILTWCALEIQDGQHKRRYVLHERSPAPEDRRLKKGHLEWLLPFVIKAGTMPFRIDHVKLTVPSQTFNFRPPTNRNNSSGKNVRKVSLIDRDVANHFAAHFDASVSPNETKGRLNLDLEYETVDNRDTGDGAKAGQLSIRITKNGSTWNDAEDRFKKHAENEIGSLTESLPQLLRQQAAKIPNWYLFLTKNKMLNKTPLFKQIKSQTDLKGKDKLSDDDLATLGQFQSKVKALQADAAKMKGIDENIRSAEVVSARIFYTVRRPKKEQVTGAVKPVSNPDNVIDINVIQFDSSQPKSK